MNRILLAACGFVLLAGGLLVLVGGLDPVRGWGPALPSWWPLHDPRQPLLDDGALTRWTDRRWWWPTVIAALGVLVLLSLWWLLAQLRGRRLDRVLVAIPPQEGAPQAAGEDGGKGGRVRLRARALEYAIAEEIRALDGVDRARVTLYGRRQGPRAKIVLTLAAHAAPASLVDRIERGPLRNARDSASLASLPAQMRLRSDRHPASRVE